MDKYGLNSLERLEHISGVIRRIFSFCDGKSEAEFLSDKMLNSGVLYQFLIIGEAIQYVETDILKKYSYPSHLPRSFRNYITHEYVGINLRQVYKTVKDLLPDFIVLIDKMIQQEGECTSNSDQK